MNALQINGNDLSFDDLRQVVYERRPVELADRARQKVVAAREVVENFCAKTAWPMPSTLVWGN